MNNVNVNFVELKLKSMPELNQLGFKFDSIEHIEKTTILDESYSINFSNNKSRSLEIVFHPRDTDKSYFLVYIINNSNSDSFNIEAWLKQNNKKKEVEIFNLESHSGNFENRIENFLVLFGEILKIEKIKRILNGETWESIDFDWAGMR